MKKLVLTLTTMLLTVVIFAKGSDILTLTNKKIFNGDVVKIKECIIVFKSINGIKYSIPANDIETLEFDDINNKVYTNYLKLINNDENACLKGTSDGKEFHGNGGIHFALGFLFGPFAIVNVALSRPDPMAGARTLKMSQNSNLFHDPTYLECYGRAVRSKNVKMASFGFGLTFLLMTAIPVIYH